MTTIVAVVSTQQDNCFWYTPKSASPINPDSDTRRTTVRNCRFCVHVLFAHAWNDMGSTGTKRHGPATKTTMFHCGCVAIKNFVGVWLPHITHVCTDAAAITKRKTLRRYADRITANKQCRCLGTVV